MAFRIPGEDGRFRQRAERAQQAREAQEKQQHDMVARRLAMRAEEEAFRQWKERMAFDLYLTAGQILMILERQRDENQPKTTDEPWNDRFCEAVRLIPEARMFAEEMSLMTIGDGGHA